MVKDNVCQVAVRHERLKVCITCLYSEKKFDRVKLICKWDEANPVSCLKMIKEQDCGHFET